MNHGYSYALESSLKFCVRTCNRRMLSAGCKFALRVSRQPTDADGAGGAGALPPAEAQEQHGDHGVGISRP